MSTLLYFFKEAVRGFVQAKLVTFVSIVTVGVTLFFLGLIGIGYWNLGLWLDKASDQPTVVVYLHEETAADSVATARLREKVGAFPQAGSVTLVDKQNAWNRFEQTFGVEMLEAVDENPLPASLEITLAPRYRGGQALESFLFELRQLGGVEDVQHEQAWQAQLEGLRRYFRLGALPIVAVLLLALHFMIANTIKLTIYARRDLVTNMHFVGATDLYIRAPFVLEGMLQGMIGGIFAVIGLLFLRATLSQFALQWGSVSLMLIVFLFVGAIFGWIGSWSAVRKFLV
jgi:cell division transport system permease protein